MVPAPTMQELLESLNDSAGEIRDSLRLALDLIEGAPIHMLSSALAEVEGVATYLSSKEGSQ
jgi:hypothetical protein